MIKKFSLAGMLLVAGFTALFGQNGPNAGHSDAGNPLPKEGVIKGIIIEGKNAVPMEYASIAVFNAIDSSLISGTISSPDGSFRIERIPMGKYYIEANFIGYEKKIISPVLITPQSKIIDLGLISLEQAKQSIDEVEVVGDRKHVDYKIDKKVVNVSQDLNAAGGTAVDVLENVPSVQVDIEGNVTVRGSSGFTVLIDGKPTVLQGSDALHQIPAASIENIEIITNPSVKYDPDGSAGIINIILKKQVQSGMNGIVNLSVGTQNKYRGDFLINYRTGKWNLFGGVNYGNNLFTGYMDKEQVTYTDSSDNYVVTSGPMNFKRQNFSVKGGFDYDLTDNSSVSFSGEVGSYGFSRETSSLIQEYSDPASSTYYAKNNSSSVRSGLFYNLSSSYTVNFNDKGHKLVAMAYFSSRNGDDTENQDDEETDVNYNPIDDVLANMIRTTEGDKTNDFRFQADYTLPLNDKGKFEAGYQARINRDFESYTFSTYDHLSEAWTVDPLYTSSMDFFRNIQAAYAMFSNEIIGIQYQLGLRGEYTYRNIMHEKADEPYIINRFDIFPTVHFAKSFKNDNQLTVSYSKRIDRPNGWSLDPFPSYIDPYNVRIGNPALLPEYIHSFELGYQKGFGMDFIAVEAYFKQTENLISRVTQLDTVSGLFIQTFENVDSDRSLGGEIMGNWTPAKWLKLNASVNAYYYTIDGEVDGSSVLRQSFNWDTRLNSTFTVSPTTRIQLNSSYRGPSVTLQGNEAGFFYMNMAVRQDLFKRKLSATLQVRDLLGTMKHDFTSSGDGFYSHVVMAHDPRVITLTLSYKINNYKIKQDDMRNESEQMNFDSGF